MADPKITILIVDDDASIVALVRQILESPDRAIHVAHSAEEALTLAKELPNIDVALLDKLLPDRSGLELAEELKRRDPDPEVILMTAYASVDSAVYALQIGAFDYLRKPFEDLNKIRFSVANAIEKSQMKRQQNHLLGQLMESNERYALAAQGANDGLWDWDLSSNRVFFSPRWKAMLGYTEDEISDDPEEWFSRIIPNDRNRVRDDLKEHQSGRSSHFQSEYRILHKDGTYRWMLGRGMVIRGDDGSAVRIAGSQTDVTLRKRAEEQLRHAALHDELTGLPNRALFRDRLNRLIERRKRSPEHMFAVLYLDLDRFKMVNESLGHPFGDELLVAIARRLQRCVRSVDTVARFDGDHFTILLDGINGEQDAVQASNRIIEELSRPFEIHGYEVFTAVSIGVAVSGPNYALPEEVERDADIAMNRAKASGGSRHEIFDQKMHERAVELLYLHTALHRAVERQEFVLHYQPVMNVETGELVGFEALIRWEHPERGMVSPAEFIPIAEDTGLIVPIGSWVLQEACRQVAEWSRKFPDIEMSMGVNLSARQFRHTALVDTVREALDSQGVDGRLLHLEVTESVLMENTESATRILESLKVLDLELHLDDFGTGFSSLSYLHRFPFDFLKIDREFVSALTTGKERKIVQGIVTLAENLGIGVVAEGVEEPGQLEALRRLGCQHAQGYLFATPMGPTDVEAWLQSKAGDWSKKSTPRASE